jgi:7-keto-8-aminopelargonate synthetase-like enzyme
LVRKEPERRETLRRNSRSLRTRLRALDYDVSDGAGQIVPLIVGDAGACMKLSGALLARGVFAQGIRPPTVPPGTSRLRITLMATHTAEHLRQALAIFEAVRKLQLTAPE